MNDFGDFLYQLRKEKGMTQAQLADMLGVSNKAVSKWETGEAMPETSLLLPISKIFGVTVDQLLQGKRQNDSADNLEKEEEQTYQKPEEKERIKIGDHIFTRGKEDNEEKTLLDMICGIVCGCLFLIGLATYLFLGAFKGAWNPCWVILPCCALSCGIIGIVFGFFNKNRCDKKAQNGENPYVGGACGIVMLVCIISYLLLGALGSLWHPYWIICASGAVVCGILGTVGNLIVFQKKKKENEKDE